VSDVSGTGEVSNGCTAPEATQLAGRCLSVSREGGTGLLGGKSDPGGVKSEAADAAGGGGGESLRAL